MTDKRNKAVITAASSHVVSTTSEFSDYKTGELITCLSQGEMMLYYILRWNDDVERVETQVPLDNKIVDQILTEALGFESPELFDDDNRTPLTTDLVAHLKNGTKRAFQVKASHDQVKGDRISRRLYIEDLYWRSLNVPWKLMLTENINRTYVDNIKNVVRYYNEDSVHDKTSRFMHLVATKQIDLDLTQRIKNWNLLSEQYFSNSGDSL